MMITFANYVADGINAEDADSRDDVHYVDVIGWRDIEISHLLVLSCV